MGEVFFENIGNLLFINNIFLINGGEKVPFRYVSAGFLLFLCVPVKLILSIGYCLLLFHVIPCVPSFIGGLVGGLKEKEE